MTADFATQIAEKQSAKEALTAEIASITANIDTLKANLKEKKTALKKAEKEARHWGQTPWNTEDGFKEFFKKEVPGNPLKAEYLIPIFIGELLEQGKMSVKVLKTNDTWYGMTYHEDVAAVKDSFKKMLENGVYKADLFSNL